VLPKTLAKKKVFSFFGKYHFAEAFVNRKFSQNGALNFLFYGACSFYRMMCKIVLYGETGVVDLS
jgi:hypothetical protein